LGFIWGGIGGHWGSLVGIGGHWWGVGNPRGIGGHQWSSVDPRGHQWILNTL